MSRGLAVKLPLRISEEFGPYDLHTDIKTMVHQNLILTTELLKHEFALQLE